MGKAVAYWRSHLLGTAWLRTTMNRDQLYCLSLAALGSVKESEGGKANRAGDAAVVQVQIGHFNRTVRRLRHIRLEVRVKACSLLDDNALRIRVLGPIHFRENDPPELDCVNHRFS